MVSRWRTRWRTSCRTRGPHGTWSRGTFTLRGISARQHHERRYVRKDPDPFLDLDGIDPLLAHAWCCRRCPGAGTCETDHMLTALTWSQTSSRTILRTAVCTARQIDVYAMFSTPPLSWSVQCVSVCGDKTRFSHPAVRYSYRYSESLQVTTSVTSTRYNPPRGKRRSQTTFMHRQRRFTATRRGAHSHRRLRAWMIRSGRERYSFVARDRLRAHARSTQTLLRRSPKADLRSSRHNALRSRCTF
jgi:hypothetical protein